MKVGELQVVLSLSYRKFQASLNKARASLQRFKAMANKVGASLKRITSTGFRILRRAALAVGVALVGATIAGARFEDAMVRTSTIVAGGMEMAEGEMSALVEEARRLGRETLYSSTQAAKGMEKLALAGFKTNEIVDSMAPIVNAAVGANMDLAETSDIVIAALRSYRMNTAETSKVTDIFMKAATSANITFGSLGEAFRYVGAIGRAAGVKLEELTAAIGLLGDAGIKGSMAGSSLRRAIVQMLKPTGEAKRIMDKLGISFLDSSGNIKSLITIIGNLQRSGAGAADMMALFGLRAGPAMLALTSMGASALGNLTKELESSGGTAKRIADKFRTTLIGRTKDLIASLNELAITMYNSFKKPLTDTVFAIRNWVLELERALHNTGILKAAVEGLKEGLTRLTEKIGENSKKFIKWIKTLKPEDVKKRFKKMGKDISDTILRAIEAVEGLTDAIKEAISGKPVDEALTKFKKAFTDIMTAVAIMIVRVLSKAFESLSPILKVIFTKSCNDILVLFAILGNKILKYFVKTIRAVGTIAIPGFELAFGKMFDTLESSMKKHYDDILDYAVLTGSAMKNDMAKVFSDIEAAAQGTVAKIKPTITPEVPDYIQEIVRKAKEAFVKPRLEVTMAGRLTPEQIEAIPKRGGVGAGAPWTRVIPEIHHKEAEEKALEDNIVTYFRDGVERIRVTNEELRAIIEEARRSAAEGKERASKDLRNKQQSTGGE